MNGLRGFVFLAMFLALAATARADEGLSPYLTVGVVNSPANDAAQKCADALTTGGFSVIGQYHPENKPGMVVVAYTRKDLQDLALKSPDRGLLAAVLKVGVKEEGGKSTVTMLNPEYLFLAYMMKYFDANSNALLKVAGDAKQALGAVGTSFAPFGGSLTTKNLMHYHYMFGMEYFNDPVILKVFSSFEEGVQTITKNLSAQKGNTSAVYALVDEQSKNAVFGVAMGDQKTGEPFFLPVIGEAHLSAMPYEIILSGETATMLHGRFRIALHWPSLTMVTFTKIISTPGDIERTMRSLAE
ncbi:MAG: hypothetical protein HY280_01870 [Nitrospinae bacterium]|nr:hypothetical protein [Nitrospinota bacterium]